MTTFLTPAHPDDPQLIQRHLAGDRAAFRQIVERYQGMVCALAYSAVGDLARSEDIAQEVFIAAWKQLPQLREPEKLRGWICGITRNLAHDSLRRAGRTPTARAGELPADLPAAGSDPRERAISADETGLMWEALRGLPEIYREPMVMFYRESQSTAAVAAALDVSEETVRQRLARGRAMLTARMATLVEETLERTAPTPAFTGLVLIALPGPLAPALLEAAHEGGSAATDLATAGTLAGAMAKGGLAVKAVSIVALLPALVNGTEEFLRFRIQHDNVPEKSMRRRMAWVYLLKKVSFGLTMLAFFAVPVWTGNFGLMRQYPLIGVATIICMVICIWAQRVLSRGLPAADPQGNWASAATKRSHFEYRTVEMLLGWPLVHLRLGDRQAWRAQPAVKAWIAISDGKAVGLFFASGIMAVAPVSLGLLSVGVMSIGGLAMGMWTLGGAAVGGVSQGGVAAGWLAAKGCYVAGGSFGNGWSGTAPHYNDAAARAYFADTSFYHFTDYAMWAFAWAGSLGWLMPVALTARQLWQTRRDARRLA